ncbi:MAG: hypothetical protein HY896_02220 [Deltaproteobacteria bacterium]|nr:hypothetical protein [Deltaproteobacteria bacterium]
MKRSKLFMMLFALAVFGAFFIPLQVYAVTVPTGLPAYYPTVLVGNTTGASDSLVLGIPDDSYINMKKDEFVIYDFGSNPILNRAGQDFNVYQWDLDGDNSGNANILVSSDGTTYFNINGSKDSKIDLQWDEAHENADHAKSYDISIAGLSSARYLKIVGVQNPFNLDAVGAVVPIPGAAWLMGTGVVALVGMKRRKSNKS